MAEELLSLKWNNHQTHFVDILSFLRENEIFIDVTIACGGKLYAAHKFVLSTCSEYFKQMFIKTPSKHPIIFMKDVSARDIEALMDFMYNGEVNVPQSTLGSLIKTAESLQIKGLAVPDDPPSRKDRDINHIIKRRINSGSSPPPAKRLKAREINYNVASALKNTPIRSKSKSPSRPMDVVSATIGEEQEEDSNSLHSATSAVSPDLKSDTKSMNENVNYLEKLSSNSLDDPFAGPSGLQKSKLEPDIKKENISAEPDIVEEDEEYDASTWGQECDSRGEEDRGEISINSDNSNLFADHMLSGNDGSSLSVSTDSAMGVVSGQRTLALSRWREDRRRRTSNLLPPSADMLHHSDPYMPPGHRRDAQYVNAAEHLRKFHCLFCRMSFKRRYTLEEHVRIHMGSRPYSCRSCGKAFTQSSSLGRHVRAKACAKFRLSL